MVMFFISLEDVLFKHSDDVVKNEALVNVKSIPHGFRPFSVHCWDCFHYFELLVQFEALRTEASNSLFDQATCFDDFFAFYIVKNRLSAF
jgi:hypothetical protein